jgi:hypothetical protein
VPAIRPSVCSASESPRASCGNQKAGLFGGLTRRHQATAGCGVASWWRVCCVNRGRRRSCLAFPYSGRPAGAKQRSPIGCGNNPTSRWSRNGRR